jgi:predicted Fe-S protein YdhL (DUF1289 family)
MPPATIPISLIAAQPWERMTNAEKRATWARLKGEAERLDTAHLSGDHDMVGSWRRYELGE